MPKDNMTLIENQEENRAYISYTDSHGIDQCIETLYDSKFPWTKRKQRSVEMANLYGLLGSEYEKKREKQRRCSVALQFMGMWDESVPLVLEHAMFCHSRLCPICSTRKAAKSAIELKAILEQVNRQHPGTRYLFLTLTIPNVTWDKLEDGITTLTKGWNNLMRQRPIARAVKGSFRAIEVTVRPGQEFHPHIHAILAVEPDYFTTSLFIQHREWVDRWQKAAKLNVSPSVRIQATYARRGRPVSEAQVNREMAAVVEAAKYVTKSSDILDAPLPAEEKAELLRCLTVGLAHRRLTSYLGWLKEAAAELGVNEDDDDLLHINPDAVSEETAERVLRFNYRFWGRFYEKTYEGEYERMASESATGVDDSEADPPYQD